MKTNYGKICPHFTKSKAEPVVIEYWKIYGHCTFKKCDITIGVCNKCPKNPTNTVNKPKPKKLLGY